MRDTKMTATFTVRHADDVDPLAMRGEVEDKLTGLGVDVHDGDTVVSDASIDDVTVMLREVS